MRAISGLLLLLAAGCSGFDEPTLAQLRGLPLPRISTAGGLPPTLPRYTRARFQMSIDSPWLAGIFEGVVLADRDLLGPQLRVQLFGDLGPKMADLTVRPSRIVGYFPQTREGIDCALPREATPHPLLFMGASLAEEFLAWEVSDFVTGICEEPEGTWLRLRPYFQGMELHRLVNRGDPRVKKRRYWWMFGVHWEEDWVSATECHIRAPNLSVRVKILERDNKEPASPFPTDLTLPEDVHLVAGSLK